MTTKPRSKADMTSANLRASWRPRAADSASLIAAGWRYSPGTMRQWIAPDGKAWSFTQALTILARSQHE